jgi:nucleotide-binding universal stress UspA family protein
VDVRCAGSSSRVRPDSLVKEQIMKVLLAIDGSPHSDAAVAQVARRPWPPGTEVKILTVIHPTIPIFPDPAFALFAAHVEQAEELRRLAPMLMGTACEQIRRGAPNVTAILSVVDGVPKDMIVQEAREWGADLIVVGSHGYGSVRSMLLGSVARAVLTDAPCSVLVARAKRVAHAAESAAEQSSQAVPEHAAKGQTCSEM